MLAHLLRTWSHPASIYKPRSPLIWTNTTQTLCRLSQGLTGRTERDCLDRDPSVKRERRSSDRRGGSQGPEAASDRTPGGHRSDAIKKEDDASDASSDGEDSVAALEPAGVGCYEQLTRLMLTNMPSKVFLSPLPRLPPGPA